MDTQDQAKSDPLADKKEDRRRLNRAPVGVNNMGKRGKLVISGNTKDIREQLKRSKWVYDPATQTWSNDLVPAHADRVREGGDDRIAFLRGLGVSMKGVRVDLDGEPAIITLDHPDSGIGESPASQSQPATTSAATTPSVRRMYSGDKAGAPRAGQTIGSKDGSVNVVTGVKSRWIEDQMRFEHEYTTRPATAEEADAHDFNNQYAALLANVRRAESAALDDDRDTGSQIAQAKAAIDEYVRKAIASGRKVPPEIVAKHA